MVKFSIKNRALGGSLSILFGIDGRTFWHENVVKIRTLDHSLR